MEEEGWIEWHPSPGRGKLSQLNFRRSRADVSENLARRYLEEGKIGHALKVLDQDTAKLAQVVESYLGVQQQEGRQVVRLPYYRPLLTLNPLDNIRRSERHIVRQLFSGLTKLDENEELKPDLAHTWEMLTPTHWRFYIRPSVRFHNGDLLTTDAIVESLVGLRQRKLFAHVEKVTTAQKNVVDLHLSRSDYHLPILLAESCAKILLPSASRSDEYDQFPIGTGPYRVAQNDEKRLVLHAFDGYFGFRPLIDSVEVWMIDDLHSSMVFPSLSKPIAPQSAVVSDDVKLDPGCTYLLLNRYDGLAKSDDWAMYFTQRLSSLNVFNQLPQDKIIELGALPAHGLKPGWYHHTRQAHYAPPPSYRTINIAYYDKHPMFPALAKALENLLKQDGLEVMLHTYDLDVPNTSEVDIWLKPMSIANHREDAIVGWLMDFSDIEMMSRPADFTRLVEVITGWQAQEDAAFPAHEIGKALADNLQLVPMFHCWLGVNQDQCGSLQNAKCNALGWFDFSKVWVKPSNER
ncbi:SgrR family transcriptional regulator [Vibrio panuliri]